MNEVPYLAALALMAMATASPAFGAESAKPAPVRIIKQPASVSTYETTTVTFQVEATGSEPLQYQWFRYNRALPGETGPQLSISDVRYSDKGAYRVEVRDAASKALSKMALLSVVTPRIGEMKIQSGVELGLPHLAGRNDGTTWLAWYVPDYVGGNYKLRLQRLDVAGRKLLGKEGVLASSVDSISWVMDYDLTTDDEGNAILVYTSNSDYVLRAQKFNAQGVPLWGASGLSLSGSGLYAGPPHPLRCPNGDILITCDQYEDLLNGASHVRVTRVKPTGELAWATPFGIDPDQGRSSENSQIIPGAGGGAILVWVENGGFDTLGDVYAQQIDPNGNAVWPQKVMVSGSSQLPFPSKPCVVADASGGFYAAWSHETDPNWFQGRIQHIDANGHPFTADGQLLSTSSTTMQLASSITYLPREDRAVVAWKETDSNQTFLGINAQSFDAQTNRLWADTGLVVADATMNQDAEAGDLRPTATGAALFLAQGSGFGHMFANVASLPAQPTALPVETKLSRSASNKSHPAVSNFVANGYWLVWEDSRGGIFGAFWTAPKE